MINKLKKIKLALIITIIASTIIPPSTYTYMAIAENVVDTPSSWAKTEIEAAKEIAFVPENILGSYGSNITREEFSELAVQLFETIVGREISVEGESPFIDTQNPNIIKANKLGIVEGKGSGIFAPYENITREEVSLILYRTLQVAKPRYDYTNPNEYIFKDYDEISTWAIEAVSYLYGIEALSGVGDNRFDPKGHTSREEAIVISKRIYDKVKATDRASRSSLAVSRSSIRRLENGSISKLKNLISQELGKPYKYGAAGPNSYDCSGLTFYLFGKLGISIPRTSKTQINAGTYVAKKDLQYGDLVLFARNGKTINHVGIYVGDGKFVHSPQTGDVVKITTLASGYYANSYYTARRVIPQ
ncbi:NlpC/P60 family protein [Tissierella sp.]|uniref:NlpC/P60 family protein n=1 Tax=Tissierella sp. TaxID=41274 RepID=UPI00285553D1|nr:NlpC/P60 family protein [Tissierella sp.]MDR7857432.1 NlpC/P60 family protein [Tissierella sp.]